MSSKKTADAALVVAEEALERVQAMERGNPFLLLVVIFTLGYVLYINLYVGHNPAQREQIIKLYKHGYARTIVLGALLLGMSGILGHTAQIASVMLGFTFVSTYITMRHLEDAAEMKQPQRAELYANFEGFADQPGMEERNFPLSHDQPRCLPCGNNTQPFNPEPYKPNSNLQGIGNDRLPPTGVDFLSDPAGVYSQSQIGYQFGMT